MTKPIILHISLLILLIAASFSGVYGQGVPVSGQVFDGNEEYPLIGGYVILQQDGVATQWKTTTDYDGNFALAEVAPGTYDLLVSYLGYSDLKQVLTVGQDTVRLGQLRMMQGVELAQVEVVEKVLAVRQKGDTTLLNAAAYKTLPDASAEELLQKMPTLAISNGEVQAQGEEVKQVIVDGKPFFGDDALATLRNLPAEIIESIEIFDEQSEESRASGFDDGNTAKTINIITKKGMRNGVFGRLSAGYGTDNRYDTGGNLNSFQGARRLSVVSMANNINRQNFAPEDLDADAANNTGSSSSDFVVKPQSGIVTTRAIGINLVDEWGEDVEVSASYFHNNAQGLSLRTLDRQYYDAEGDGERYRETGVKESENGNHRFDGRLRWRIDEKNRLVWRPRLSVQNSEGQNNSLGSTVLNGVPVDSSQNYYSGNYRSLNLNNYLFWQHRFDKSRRTFSVSLNHYTIPQTNQSTTGFIETADGEVQREVNQQNQTERARDMGSISLQYTEPVSKRSSLLLVSKTSVREELSEQLAYDYDPVTAGYTDLDTDQSGRLTNDYLSQEVGTGLNYYMKGVRLTAKANLQYARLINDQEIPPLPTNERSFLSVLPTLSLQWKKSGSGNLNLVYRSNTRLPSATQLQELVNRSNPRFIRTGNPNLRQEIRHNMHLRFNSTNATAGTVFYTLIGGGVTQHDITNGIFTAESEVGQSFDLPVGTRVSQPVNLDESWNLRVLTTIGFPVELIGSNLNLDISATTNRQPGLINGETNEIQNSTGGLGLTFSSNVSNRIDFSMASKGKYNWVSNALQPANNNQYFQQTSRLNLNWIIGPGIVFRSDLTHRFYRGLSEELNQDFLLWNLSLGKKMMKNDRGEVSLSVFDLLGQNLSLQRHVASNYTQDVETDVLSSYVKLGFRYDLRKFGS
ncbi:outer membrane beta-barrel protein [Neolewinella aurantiaca]|uniref:Outer membrane beta-barrel protein n=1 Tax=Neolewinella aurantiaca TaxID=2602767 RepID=A0A5C7FAV4_9BACT|nr:TonB-dependent receptor [Neolewinella aurantiaca]TXF87964.1 outer membrane beta-barrel protein [Neolewinella aurantiaca]